MLRSVRKCQLLRFGIHESISSLNCDVPSDVNFRGAFPFMTPPCPQRISTIEILNNSSPPVDLVMDGCFCISSAVSNMEPRGAPKYNPERVYEKRVCFFGAL